MTHLTLSTAVFRLTEATYDFSDADLEQPYKWRAHDEGVRFALLGTHFELRELAARLNGRRPSPPTWAQRILGQYLDAYWDLRAVLIGLKDVDYDSEPTAVDWPMRIVLAHMVAAQRTFFTLADYGLRRQKDQGLPLDFPQGEVEWVVGSRQAFNEVMEGGNLAGMLALADEIHLRTLERFSNLSDDELEARGPVWWESEAEPIHYRLQRMEAHLRQHTIQVEKTLSAIGRPPNEARRLLRLIYGALAGVEAIVLGAPDLGQSERAALAETIVARAEEAMGIVQGARSLLEAVRAGDEAEVGALLENNPALADAQDQAGLPAVLVAAYHNQPAIVETLLAAGAELSIFEAAALGDLEKVGKAHAEWADWIHEYGRDGFNPLHLACYFGHEKTAAWLIDQGADVDAVARNEQLIRPLHAAAARGHVGIVRLLLEHGADRDARQHGGYTALHAAAHAGNTALAELLLAHGADPSLATEDGQTARALAVAAGHQQTAQLL